MLKVSCKLTCALAIGCSLLLWFLCGASMVLVAGWFDSCASANFSCGGIVMIGKP